MYIGFEYEYTFCFYIFVLERLLQSVTDVCDCIVPCKTFRYNPNLSYTHLSKMNIERLVLLDDNEKEQVKQEFEKASETLHRVRDDLVQDDIQRMTRIIETAHSLDDILEISSRVYTNFSRFSSEYKVIDILGYASGYIEEDFQYYTDKIEASAETLKDLMSYYKVQYFSNILQIYTPLDNGSYNYFNTFTSCLATGLNSRGDTKDVENATESTTGEYETMEYETKEYETMEYETKEYETMEYETIEYGQIEYETYISNPDNDDNTAPWEQLNDAPNVSNFQSYRSVFNSIECDISVLHFMQYRFYGCNELLKLLVDSVKRYREWYLSLTAFFPQDNIEQHNEHKKCMDTLDWFKNEGMALFTEYYQYINNMTEKVNVIIDKYIYDYEDRNVHDNEDKNVHDYEEQDDIAGEVQSLYKVVSSLNDYLISDRAAPLWKLTTSGTLNYDENGEPVIPDDIEAPDPVSCLWLLKNLFSTAEVGTKANLNLMYYTSNHENLIKAFVEFSDLLKTVRNYYQRKIKPDIEHFHDYLSDDIKKLELVTLVRQPKSIKSMDQLVDKVNSIDDALDDLIEKMNTESEKAGELLMMPLNFSVPLLSYQTINETVFGREMYKYRTELYTGYDDYAMQDHFQSTFLSTGKRHFQRILNVFGVLQDNITNTMDSFVDQLAEEREYLQTYKRDTRMDAEFYMLVTCSVIIIQLSII